MIIDDMNDMKQGLYLVPTPIGNLSDMTFRGIEVLKNCDVVCAEDTRHSRKLFSHFDIHTPLISYHDHNRRSKGEYILSLLMAGKTIAVISDAGTPGISDPGYDIARDAIAHGITVVPLPGANACLTGLIGSGLPTDRFTFEGFLPRQNRDRKERYKQIAKEQKTMIFYISPHKHKEDIKDLINILGSDRTCALCRELTKIHETFYRGSLQEVYQVCQDNELKGEMVLIVDGYSNTDVEEKVSIDDVKDELILMINDGISSKEASQILAKKYGYPKREIYQLTFDKEDN